MDMDRFNLNKLNDGEVKEQYQVTIKYRIIAPPLEGINCRAY
jgi:hypothetical protein